MTTDTAPAPTTKQTALLWIKLVLDAILLIGVGYGTPTGTPIVQIGIGAVVILLVHSLLNRYSPASTTHKFAIGIASWILAFAAIAAVKLIIAPPGFGLSLVGSLALPYVVGMSIGFDNALRDIVTVCSPQNVSEPAA